MEVRSYTLIVCIIAIAAASPLDGDLNKESDRSLRVGSNNGGSTNNDNSSPAYSVSFVPLFSLLANFFPRFFSRFSGVNHPASRETGRGFIEQEEYSHDIIKINNATCSLSHLGQWEDEEDCHRFYICSANPKSPSHCADKTTTNELTSRTGSSHLGSHQISSKPLMIQIYSNPCIIMTVFECPYKSVYSNQAGKCISEDDIEASQLC